MKSVIVLSVNAWGAVLIFPEVALDRTIFSHMLRHRLSFPRGAVVRSQAAKIFSWLCSAPLRKHSRSSCGEKSRLLEGGEVIALL